MQQHIFKTIVQPSIAEFSDKGSKFIANAFPLKNADDFKLHLKVVTELHPKAVHNCFAYRIGIDKNNFRSSDDGEPSGSAGRPILGQIDSKQLTDTLIVVTRYFGGVLLGVPGLINAYKKSALLAIENTEIITVQIENNYTLTFEYLQLEMVMNWIKRNQINVINKELNTTCVIVISIPILLAEKLLSELNRFIDAKPNL